MELSYLKPSVVAAHTGPYSAIEDESADDLHRVSAGFACVEQAKGILMGRYRLDAAAAFALLQRWSRRSGIAIAHLATVLTQAAVDHGNGASEAGQDAVDWVVDQLGYLDEARNYPSREPEG